MQEQGDLGTGERTVLVGGVFDRRAGCLLVPFIPIRAAGALIVTTGKVVFDPILHYKLFARKLEIPLDQIERAETGGSNIGLNVLEIVSFGKDLTLKFKSGRSRTFRSVQADELAEAINATLRGDTYEQDPSAGG